MLKINVKRYKLSNDLRIVVNEDFTTPLVAVNVLYKVGSKDENPEKTGFAHLFEHLLFTGTKNVANFDEIVQLAYGENNAFTNTDITNYYINLPAINIEIALWLEADRMQFLNINSNSLEVQKKVVIEEFKQHYLNKPYGDVSHLLRSLIYKKHSYQWPTIGKKIEHIENATLLDVEEFYENWYVPNNAILSISGNVNSDEVINLIEKWFGQIPPHKIKLPIIEEEPEKKERTFLQVERNVPSSAIYMAFLMSERRTTLYYAYDMLSDILGNGNSSRLYQSLVKQKPIFSSINSYISGSIDKGYLIIEGKIHNNYSLEQAEEEIWKVINEIPDTISEKELQKQKNKYEANFIGSLIDINNKAEFLAYYEYLFDDANSINYEIEKYNQITINQINKIIKEEIVYNKSVVLYYKKSDL